MAKRTRKRQALRDLAKALNACDDAGLRVRLEYGIVYTKLGYIVPWDKRDKNKWTVRRTGRRFDDRCRHYIYH